MVRSSVRGGVSAMTAVVLVATVCLSVPAEMVTARPAGAVAAPLSLVVDTGVDQGDVDPGDGICRDASGTCSLRAAVDETNAWATAGDTITIAPHVNPKLTIAGTNEDANATGDIDILTDLTIDGGGATVDGNHLDRVFDHLGGTLVLERLTIAHGLLNNAGDASVQGPGGIDTIGISGAGRGAPANFGSGSGGGLQSVGPLTLDHVVVRDNGDRNAPFAEPGDPGRPTGGGIAASGGPVSLVDTQVIGNSVAHTPSGDGGGVAIEGVADLTITDSTFSSNMINGSDESIVGNGGGLDLDGSSGVITGSTIDHDQALIKDGAGAGGLSGGSLLIVNSTISDNASPGSDVQVEGAWAVVDSTIVGLAVVFGSGSLDIAGSILTGCLAGTATSDGWNIFGDTSCGTLAPSDLVSDPLLGPLAHNRGHPRTRLPGAGSPAIDRIPLGTPVLCDGTIATDQRGVVRPRGAGCDVGAVEQ